MSLETTLDHPNWPKEAQPAVVETVLFPHQQQCLNWMLYRETPRPQHESLWDQDPVTKVWINKFTGERMQERAQDCLGGILADDVSRELVFPD